MICQQAGSNFCGDKQLSVAAELVVTGDTGLVVTIPYHLLFSDFFLQTVQKSTKIRPCYIS